MPITFQCQACGKSFTVPDNLAGKKGQCKQCGDRFTIPARKTADLCGLEDLAGEAEEAEAVVIARATPRSSAPSKADGTFLKVAIGVGSGVALLAVLAIAVSLFRKPTPAKPAVEVAANPPVEAEPSPPLAVEPSPPKAAITPQKPGNSQSSIVLPAFPDRGPGREIEPGITVHEIVLGPPDPAPDRPPGHCGRLWLYLPSGQQAARSLPCILIAGAGSTLFAGMKLAQGDIVEHLPYVRAGFAVLAFDVDGMLENRQNPSTSEVRQAASRFLNARAGLVNAHIAFEYVLAKVPEIDPAQITAAGHSSAGTLALLFTEHEPRLRSCIAYAPVSDIAAHFQKFDQVGLMNALTEEGFGAFFTRYAPKTLEAKLDRPLFLFYALEDLSAPLLDALGQRLKTAGQPVTISTVPDGGHYDAMIDPGIRRGIAWLKQQQPSSGR